MACDWPSLRGEADLRRLGRTRFGPGELDLTAFHPLGTARMGRDPATSVVDQDHRVHGHDDWWVVDGSVDGVAVIVQSGSKALRLLQTGIVQNYLLVMALGIFVFATIYVILT